MALAILTRRGCDAKNTTVRRWTQTAIECYKRGCRCSGCFYNDFFAGSPQKCQMKYTVLELVRVIGKPDAETESLLLEEIPMTDDDASIAV